MPLHHSGVHGTELHRGAHHGLQQAALQVQKLTAFVPAAGTPRQPQLRAGRASSCTWAPFSGLSLLLCEHCSFSLPTECTGQRHLLVKAAVQHSRPCKPLLGGGRVDHTESAAGSAESASALLGLTFGSCLLLQHADVACISLLDVACCCRAYDRAALKLRGPTAVLNHTKEDYDDDEFMKVG